MKKIITILGALGATLSTMACSSDDPTTVPGGTTAGTTTAGTTTAGTTTAGTTTAGTTTAGTTTAGTTTAGTTTAGTDSTGMTGAETTTGAGGNEIIFSGEGTWVDLTENTIGIQGAFFVLEDSMKDGVLVADSLPHTDLTPDEFDDMTAMPCVSGTVAQVTNSAGEVDCNWGDATATPETVCQWDAQWGGGIGFNLSETGGEGSVKSPWDATAAGVTGFVVKTSGNAEGATIRFKAKDTTEQEFCYEIELGVEEAVSFSDFQHECWGTSGTAVLDTTQLVQLEWQVVSSETAGYAVSNFCVDGIAALK